MRVPAMLRRGCCTPKSAWLVLPCTCGMHRCAPHHCRPCAHPPRSCSQSPPWLEWLQSHPLLLTLLAVRCCYGLSDMVSALQYMCACDGLAQARIPSKHAHTLNTLGKFVQTTPNWQYQRGQPLLNSYCLQTWHCTCVASSPRGRRCVSKRGALARMLSHPRISPTDQLHP